MSLQRFQDEWRALAQAALSGSAQRPWQVASKEETAQSWCGLLEQIAQSPLSMEQRMLQAAALLRWVAACAEGAPSPLLQLPPRAGDAQKAPATAQQCALLQELFSLELHDCLAHWLAGAQAAQIAIPPVLLPRMLDWGRQHIPLRQAIAAALDVRGQWLARLHPDWRWALREESSVALDAQVWLTGRLEERAQYLRQWRQRDPAAARAALQAVWGEEKAQGRQTLLAALESALSEQDAAWLDSILQDKSKPVRQQALQLLRLLPHSSWRRRMRERAHAALRLERSSPKHILGRMAQGVRNLIGSEAAADWTWRLELPASFTPDMLQDGMEQKPAVGKGERAWWLTQILAAVPARDWFADDCPLFGDDSETARQAAYQVLLQLCQGHEWEKLLRQALQENASLYRERALAQALLAGKTLMQWRAETRSESLDFALLKLLPPAQLHALLRQHLGELSQAAPNRIALMRDTLFPLLESLQQQSWEYESSAALLEFANAVLLQEKEMQTHALRHWLWLLAPRLDLSALQAWWSAMTPDGRALLGGFGTPYIPDKMPVLIDFRSRLAQAFAAALPQPGELA
ncbi:DUF5691 domain-containing protein [Massilia sp. W12]|uniref:DUF5691 domain-containing protein n=1 Tax=Massilia sp. W12 TaxID=3126507 RepID=UPI0030D41A66